MYIINAICNIFVDRRAVKMEGKIRCMAVYSAVDMILSKLNAELLNELLTKFRHQKNDKDSSEIRQIIMQAIKVETAARVSAKL